MKRISLLVMAFMVMFSCSAFAETNEWEHVTTTKLESVYFSNQKLNFDMEGNIDFDERSVLSEAGVKDFLDHCSKSERSKYKNVSYIEKFRTLNGNKVKTNLLMIYDKNNKMIEISNDEQPWDTLVVGTIDYSTACKVSQYVQAHYDEVMKRTK